jgi:hypothetical protein
VLLGPDSLEGRLAVIENDDAILRERGNANHPQQKKNQSNGSFHIADCG